MELLVEDFFGVRFQPLGCTVRSAVSIRDEPVRIGLQLLANKRVERGTNLRWVGPIAQVMIEQQGDLCVVYAAHARKIVTQKSERNQQRRCVSERAVDCIA